MPIITKPNQHFDATLITGTAATQVITNSGSMQPDMVWLKSRSNANSHTLYDALRGVNTLLYPNSTNAEAVGVRQLTAFNSNGFTLGSDENANDQVGELSVGWQWKAGGTAVTNTSGSISSQVSVNTTAGFSIVTYTGTGSNATVGHGLGVTPAFYIVKQRTASSATSWYCYHSSIDPTIAGYYAIYLNLTNGRDSAQVFWNNTAPTSSVFSLGTSTGVNGSGGTYVAYCWAPVAGYSAFGSYTGNGSSDGPFIYTGFRPAFVLTKRSDSTGNWYLWDNKRIISANGDAGLLYPESSNAESDYNAAGMDLLSNGFKIRNSDSSDNGSGGTFIYMAFAEAPFKYSSAR